MAKSQGGVKKSTDSPMKRRKISRSSIGAASDYNNQHQSRFTPRGDNDGDVCNTGEIMGSPYKEKKPLVSKSTAQMNSHIEAELHQLTKV